MKAIVVGLPRSGSTLLCRIIHSSDDCVCLSEPHFEFQALRTCETLKDNKVSNLDLEFCSDSEMPLDLAMSELEKIFKIAAFKETFRPEPFRQWETYNEDLLETYKKNGYKVIGIVRSPFENFNSWKTKKKWGSWTNNVDLFTQTYRSLVQFCDGRALRFEDLLSSPVQVMNRLNVTFYELGPMAAALGDSEALTSTSVKQANKNKNILSADDIKAIEESGLIGLYNSIECVSSSV